MSIRKPRRAWRGFYEFRAQVACGAMPMRVAETILLAMAEAPEGRDANLQRVLGGIGLIVAVALLLTVPLVIAVRSSLPARDLAGLVALSRTTAGGITIGLVSLVLSFIATLYPSWRASRVNPAEALRYE